VDAADVEDLSDVRGHINRSEALGLLSQADALLLLSVDAPGVQDVFYSKGIYPGKTFEYFGARRPILCVPGDRGLLDDLIRKTQTGVVLRTPLEVADHLTQALRDWKAGREFLYRPDEAVVSRYTRRGLASRLAAILDEVVSRRAGKGG
jgi:hypothetical protein